MSDIEVSNVNTRPRRFKFSIHVVIIFLSGILLCLLLLFGCAFLWYFYGDAIVSNDSEGRVVQSVHLTETVMQEYESSHTPRSTRTAESAPDTPWLKEGIQWEFFWTKYEESRAMGSNPEYSHNSGRFTLTLGKPVKVSGKELYRLIVTGDPGDLEPRWALIGTDSHGRIWGGLDESSEPLPVYDPTGTESWPGGGFFVDFSKITNVDVKQGRRILFGPHHPGDQLFQGPATQVGYSFDKDNCQYFPEVGAVCGSDADHSRFHYEYWSKYYGPVGMHYGNYYSDCGGGFCSSINTEIDISMMSFGEIPP